MIVAAFYRFVPLSNLPVIQQDIRSLCEQEGILGTCLLAEEGINATVSGSAAAIKKLVEYLQAQEPFLGLEVKYSRADRQPFDRLKVLIKKEIVTFGVPSVKPHEKTGISVAPESWDALIAQHDVVLIDTRNDYEISQGTFPGALNPKTEKFTDFIDYVRTRLTPKQKVAMFCTGGIRCEKASAFLLQEGFETVYQLEGGILNYLASVPKAKQSWQGECFIFDDRGAVGSEQLLSKSTPMFPPELG